MDLTDKKVYVYKVNQEKIPEAAESVSENPNQINDSRAANKTELLPPERIEVLNANTTELVPPEHIKVFEDPLQISSKSHTEALKMKHEKSSRLPVSVRPKNQIAITPKPPTDPLNDKENRVSGTKSCLKAVPQAPKKRRTRRSTPEKKVVFNQEHDRVKLFMPDKRSPYVDPRRNRVRIDVQSQRTMRSSMAKALANLNTEKATRKTNNCRV